MVNGITQGSLQYHSHRFCFYTDEKWLCPCLQQPRRFPTLRSPKTNIHYCKKIVYVYVYIRERTSVYEHSCTQWLLVRLCPLSYSNRSSLRAFTPFFYALSRLSRLFDNNFVDCLHSLFSKHNVTFYRENYIFRLAVRVLISSTSSARSLIFTGFSKILLIV